MTRSRPPVDIVSTHVPVLAEAVVVLALLIGIVARIVMLAVASS